MAEGAVPVYIALWKRDPGCPGTEPVLLRGIPIQRINQRLHRDPLRNAAFDADPCGLCGPVSFLLCTERPDVLPSGDGGTGHPGALCGIGIDCLQMGLAGDPCFFRRAFLRSRSGKMVVRILFYCQACNGACNVEKKYRQRCVMTRDGDDLGWLYLKYQIQSYIIGIKKHESMFCGAFMVLGNDKA